MTDRKIKLALTVGLINQKSTNPLHTAQELMAGFRDEVGAFISADRVSQQIINKGLTLRRYAIRFEKTTLNLELICDRMRRQEVVQGFKLR